MEKVFALVDCNNFYVSCERLFDPSLLRQPVIILSNNDGCIIARSDEAKNLGIKMGEPFFLYKGLIRKKNLKVLSSNFSLYGDLSRRVMTCLQSFSCDMEIYSIDEAFLLLPKGKDETYKKICLRIRKKILKWTGIPVSIGIGPSKTLAKLANRVAKKDPSRRGVFSLTQKNDRDEALKGFSLSDIWGVSSKKEKTLKALGVYDAWDLRESNLDLIKKYLTVVTQKTCLELRGISCLDLEEVKDKKSICSSKSFGSPLKVKGFIEEALSNYVFVACQKLRSQKSLVSKLIVTLTPQNNNRRMNSSVREIVPTDDTRMVLKEAKLILKEIYKENIYYKKVSVILLKFTPGLYRAQNLFESTSFEKNVKLMKVLDSVTQNYGTNSLYLGSQGILRPWEGKSQRKSPNYTKSWGELACVS